MKKSPEHANELQVMFKTTQQLSPQTQKYVQREKFDVKDESYKDQHIGQFFKEKFKVMSNFLQEDNLNRFISSEANADYQNNNQNQEQQQQSIEFDAQNKEEIKSAQNQKQMQRKKANADDVEDIALLKYIEKDEVPKTTLERMININQSIKAQLLQEAHDDKIRRINQLQFQKNNSIFKFMDSLPEMAMGTNEFVRRNRIPQRDIQTLALRSSELKHKLVQNELKQSLMRSQQSKDDFFPSEHSRNLSKQDDTSQQAQKQKYRNNQSPSLHQLHQEQINDLQFRFVSKKPYNKNLDPQNKLIQAVFTPLLQHNSIQKSRIEQATMFGQQYQEYMRQTRSEFKFYQSQSNFGGAKQLHQPQHLFQQQCDNNNSKTSERKPRTAIENTMQEQLQRTQQNTKPSTAGEVHQKQFHQNYNQVQHQAMDFPFFKDDDVVEHQQTGNKDIAHFAEQERLRLAQAEDFKGQFFSNLFFFEVDKDGQNVKVPNENWHQREHQNLQKDLIKQEEQKFSTKNKVKKEMVEMVKRSHDKPLYLTRTSQNTALLLATRKAAISKSKSKSVTQESAALKTQQSELHPSPFPQQSQYHVPPYIYKKEFKQANYQANNNSNFNYSQRPPQQANLLVSAQAQKRNKRFVDAATADGIEESKMNHYGTMNQQANANGSNLEEQDKRTFMPYKKYQDVPSYFFSNYQNKNLFNYIDAKEWQNKF